MTRIVAERADGNAEKAQAEGLLHIDFCSYNGCGFPMWRVVLFLSAAIVLAQDSSVFRTTTQLVRIDVVAQDKNGNPVADLGKDDFVLTVNRKPQRIDTFTVTSTAPEPPVALPRGTFSNKQAAAEASQGRYTVFLLDWRNTNWMLQSFAHQQLLKMLSDAPPGGKIALYLVNDGFQIVQEFTSDRELLKAKAESLWGEVPPPLITLDQAELAASDTIAAFQGIAKHLAGISGQKVLIWVSLGFPDNAPYPSASENSGGATPRSGAEWAARLPPPGGLVGVIQANAAPSPSFLQDIDKAVRNLGNSNIVVESVEAKYLGAHVLAEVGSNTSYVNTLQMIAERTGGRFFPGDTNDMASTLRSAANDRATSYELGYYAGDSLLPGLQPFEIKCRRPGITLRYREGYYIDKKPPAAQTDTRVLAQDILEGAVDATAIPLRATAVRTAGNVSSIMLRLNIDAHALALQQEGGLWQAKMSTFARFATDVEDQVGDVPLDSPSLSLTQDQYDRELREGITLHFTMKIPDEAVTLRVLVRDEGTGNVGTVTISMANLPEF